MRKSCFTEYSRCVKFLKQRATNGFSQIGLRRVLLHANMGRKAQAGAAASSSGFIGFSSFAAPAAVESSQNRNPALSEAPLRALPPFYDGNHSELALICKRLTKKDATTKLKALQQLQSLCGSSASDAALAEAGSNTAPLDPAAVAGLLPHWVFLYSRLVIDNDRRVREALNTTLQSVALIDRRAVAPYLRQLLGPWCMSMADSVAEVAAAAVRAFEGVFPAARRRAVLLKEHRADVVSHFSTTLALTPEALSEPFACSAEEAAERYERVVVSCLSAVAALLRAPLVAAAATAATAGAAPAETPAAAAATAAATGEEQQLIGDLLQRWLTDPQAAFRRAACAVLCSCCEAHAFSDSSEQPSRLAPAVLALPLDAEPANHSAAFSALLLFMQAHPAAVAAARCEALLLRPLLKQLRAGAYLPSAGASYASLLPLLAGLPSEALEQHRPGGGAAYYGRLLEAVWAGLAAAGNNGNSLVSAAASCMRFTIQ
jgi:hypothetical protein